MITEQNVPVSISPEQLLGRMKSGRGRRRRSPDFQPLVEDVCALLPNLLQPAVSWSLTEKEEFSEGMVYLRDPVSGKKGRLKIGKRSNFLEQAHEVVLAVKTIGPLLEAKVHGLEAEDPLKAYALDVAGVIALDQVSDWFREKIQVLAREKGWGVSPSLLPGSLTGWPVEGQGEICHFLDLGKIGVTLNRFSVLKPHKSDSVAIGLGPGYTEQVVASLCSDCPRKEVCPWKR